MQTPATLEDAIVLYAASTSLKAASNLKTTLKLYVLKGFKFRGCTKVKLENYPQKIMLSDFINEAESSFDQAYNQSLKQGKHVRTLANNRSNLNCFLRWIKMQPWHLNATQTERIPERAPKMMAGINLPDFVKGRRAYGADPYSLKEHELTPRLLKQLNDLHSYLTTKYMPTRRGEPCIRDTSWQTYRFNILCFLGWLKNVEGFNLDYLDITFMSDKATLNDYLTWHFSVRGNGYQLAISACDSALNIAKWHAGKASKKPRFTDCDLVLDVRAIQNELRLGLKNDRRTTSPEALREKLLELDQCQEVVEYLRQCCARRDADGRSRPIHSVIDSWRDYLIISILTYTPVRQREIRELKINENLRREADGWWVTLTPEEHKTGSKTGKSREYPLFAGHSKEKLSRDLDEYVNQWRPLANLDHSYLFFLRGGKGYPHYRGRVIPNAKHLARVVPGLMMRITALLYGKENAKHPTPHDFRRIFATWLYSYGTFEEQDLYAELMGHSIEEARRTYALVTSRDKTQRADEAFQAVTERAKRIKEQKLKRYIAFDPQV